MLVTLTFFLLFLRGGVRQNSRSVAPHPSNPPEQIRSSVAHQLCISQDLGQTLQVYPGGRPSSSMQRSPGNIIFDPWLYLAMLGISIYTIQQSDFRQQLVGSEAPLRGVLAERLAPKRFTSRGPESYRSPSPPTPATQRPAHSAMASEAPQRQGFSTALQLPTSPATALRLRLKLRAQAQAQGSLQLSSALAPQLQLQPSGVLRLPGWLQTRLQTQIHSPPHASSAPTGAGWGWVGAEVIRRSCSPQNNKKSEVANQV